ncbi:UNVERIFIED_CONTAM: hypothetical protein FKN15_066382 [Acipenser sinensis]
MFHRPAGRRESEGRQDASVNQPPQPREPTEEDDAVAGSSTAGNTELSISELPKAPSCDDALGPANRGYKTVTHRKISLFFLLKMVSGPPGRAALSLLSVVCERLSVQPLTKGADKEVETGVRATGSGAHRARPAAPEVGAGKASFSVPQARREELPLPEPREEELPLPEPRGEELPLTEPRGEELLLPEPREEELPLPEPREEELPLPEHREEELPLPEPREEELPLPEPREEELPLPEPRGEDEKSIPPPQPQPPPLRSSPAQLCAVPRLSLLDTLSVGLDLPSLDLEPRSQQKWTQFCTWFPAPLLPDTKTSLTLPLVTASLPLGDRTSLHWVPAADLCPLLQPPVPRMSFRSPLTNRWGPSSPVRGPYLAGPGRRPIHPRVRLWKRAKIDICGLECGWLCFRGGGGLGMAVSVAHLGGRMCEIAGRGLKPP